MATWGYLESIIFWSQPAWLVTPHPPEWYICCTPGCYHLFEGCAERLLVYCVLRSARMQLQKSRQLGQNYISPEHIVLALFTTGDSGVKAVIERYTPCSFPQPAMLGRQLSGAHMPQHQWPVSDSVACDASSVSWLAESLGSSFTTTSFDTPNPISCFCRLGLTMARASLRMARIWNALAHPDSNA